MKYFQIVIIIFLFISLTSCETGEKPYVITVNGRIEASSIGITLSHEHVLVDFIGADSVSKNRYDEDSVFNKVLPYLQELKKYNVNTFFEATPAYLGRDVELLKRLSEKTGINIVTNTGYYAANGNIHLPKHFYDESVDTISRRWVKEFENGIDGTQIRPGYIKISINEGPISDIDSKVVRAAARTHLETGLTIMAHTGTAIGAFEEIKILEEENVDPSALIWVHAQAEQDLEKFVTAAEKGVWISFDGAGWQPVELYLKLLQNMKTNNVLNRTLISHDAGWYSVGEPNGGMEFKPFTFIFSDLIPALKDNGFTKGDIDMLLVKNPQEAFAVRVRKLR